VKKENLEGLICDQLMNIFFHIKAVLVMQIRDRENKECKTQTIP